MNNKISYATLAAYSAGFTLLGYGSAFPYEQVGGDWPITIIYTVAPALAIVTGWNLMREEATRRMRLTQVLALAMWAIGIVMIAFNAGQYISYLAPIDGFRDGLMVAFLTVAPALTVGLLIADVVVKARRAGRSTDTTG